MPNTTGVPWRTPADLSLTFAEIMDHLQKAVVRVGVASRSHLAEGRRPASEGLAATEGRTLALRTTAEELAAAMGDLDAAFAQLRENSRLIGQAVIKAERAQAEADASGTTDTNTTEEQT